MNLWPWRLPNKEKRFEVDAWGEKVAASLVGKNDVSVGEVLVGALGIAYESWSQTAKTVC